MILLSEILLIWAVATASGRPDVRWSKWASEKYHGLDRLAYPIGRATLAAAAAAVATWGRHGIVVAGITGLGVLCVFYVRNETEHRGFLAQGELLSVALFSVAASGYIWWHQLEVGFPYLRLPVDGGRLACIQFGIFAAIIGIWHSGNIVLGVLNREDVLPERGQGKGALQHGRLIGYLERLMIMILVSQGSYEGLGFLIAAKGLIRSKELTEHRELVEYFLIGSLLSVLCAVVVALFISFVFGTLW